MRNKTVASGVRIVAACAFAVTALTLSFAGTALAQTYNVTNESGLAAAVASANSAGGANTINLAGGSYDPTTTLNVVNGALTLQGPTPTPTSQPPQAILTGGDIVPVGASLFTVAAGATVNFDNLDFSNAGTIGADPVIDDSGIANLNQTTISPTGPGIDVEQQATANVVNSTISDGQDFGIIDDGTATLTNSTVTRNSNGGIDSANSTALNLINSIVAYNGYRTFSPTNSDTDCNAPATTSDHSLDGDGTCGLTGPGDLSQMNPHLGPIATHGGTTQTDVPATGSPVIGAGDGATCPSVDERGAPRPGGGAPCDIGSVQTFYGVPLIFTSTETVTGGKTTASGGTAMFTPTWAAGAPVATTCTAQLGTPPTTTTVVSAPAANATVFPIGNTTVTCTGNDATFGDTGTGMFTVTIITATAPVITVPANISVAATSATGAIVPYPAATATDSDGTTPPVTCTAPVGSGGSTVTAPPSGIQYPVGTTTVTCTATDSGLTSTKTFTITVAAYVPPSPPTFSATTNLTANATSASGAVVTYTLPTATDPVGGGVTDPVTCTPASGSTFPIGPTTVNCTATAQDGVSGSTSFTVTVEPGAAPTVTVPADIAVPATMPGGAVVTYTASATDPLDGPIAVTCTPGSGATFAIGTTTVNCSATDSLGNTTTNTFTVTVTQSLPPMLVVPANITAVATSAGGAKVSFTVTATDPVDGALTPTCTPASGSTFPVGTTTVTCTATNHANVSTAQSFTVTVPVPTGPVITVPAYREFGALNAAGDPVTYTVTATDQVDGSDPVTCTPASGSTFPIGTTVVTCTATDSGGRTATATFDVTVNPPFAAPPPSNSFSLPAERVKGDEIEFGVKVPSAGKVVLLATFESKVKGKTKAVTFGRVSATVKTGTRTLTIKPDKAGLTDLGKLAKSKKLSLRITLTYTPTGGTASVRHKTVKLDGREP